MNFRLATLNDCALLAELNHQLIRDEGHRNKMTVPELEQRMKGWLASEYAVVLLNRTEELSPTLCTASKRRKFICGNFSSYGTSVEAAWAGRPSKFCAQKSGRQISD